MQYKHGYGVIAWGKAIFKVADEVDIGFIHNQWGLF